MRFLEPFKCPAPPPFDGVELHLAAPERGHTCTLRWAVADGALVAAGETVFRQEADADPADRRSLESPFPARVQIDIPDGRFLRPGPVGRLHYGYALEAAFRRTWQELALALAAALGRRRQAAPPPPLPPRDLSRLVFLDFTLARKLEAAGLRRPPPAVPADLREDRALAALEELGRWKAAAVMMSPEIPADVRDRTVVLWAHLFANLAATLRHEGFAPENGLTAERPR